MTLNSEILPLKTCKFNASKIDSKIPQNILKSNSSAKTALKQWFFKCSFLRVMKLVFFKDKLLEAYVYSYQIDNFFKN